MDQIDTSIMLITESGEVAVRQLGRLVITPGAEEVLSHGGNIMEFISRHVQGDCPHLDPEDQEMNALGVANNGYLMTSWDLEKGTIWIITEHDRSVTTILTPEEY